MKPSFTVADVLIHAPTYAAMLDTIGPVEGYGSNVVLVPSGSDEAAMVLASNDPAVVGAIIDLLRDRFGYEAESVM